MSEGIIQRKYSLDEIDEMRSCINIQLNAGLVIVSENGARLYQNADEIERRLRTYMMAGVDPGELFDKAHAAQTERDNAKR